MLQGPILTPAVLILLFLASVAGTRLVLEHLRRRQILDLPNDRSSHSVPTPRGGGLAVAACLIPAWVWAGGGDGAAWLAAGLALALAALSWVDDLRGLGPAPRFLGQIAAVCLALIFDTPSFPAPFDGVWLLVVMGLGWVWFINLYNFMDGIDGITGVETLCIGLGAALVALTIDGSPSAGLQGLAAAATAIGFLLWNWHPARIFLGDVGSITLGFLLGGLLVHLAADGAFVSALILAFYFLADATITLGRRALRGEKVWQAHREHFYQKATQSGLSHAQVSARIFAANLGLVGLAVWAAKGYPLPALVSAALLVAALLFHLGRKR